MVWATFFIYSVLLISIILFRSYVHILLVALLSIFFTVDILFSGLTSIQVGVVIAFISIIARQNFVIPKISSLFLIYAIYCFVMVVLNPINESFNYDYGILQSPKFRGYISSIFHISQFLFFILAFSQSNWKRLYSKFEKSIILACLVSMSFGLFQIIITSFTLSANPLFELFTLGFTYDQDVFPSLRPSPFVLEPRYFALVMIIGLYMYIDSAISKNINVILSHRLFIAISFIFVIIACASTSALLASIFGIIFLSLSNIYKFNFSGRYIFVVITFIAIISLTFDVTKFNYAARFSEYSLRMQEGIITGNAALSTDAFILWLIENPNHIYFGVGHGQGGFFAYPYIGINSGFSDTGFMSSRVGLLDLIASVGIFGTFLVHFIIFLILRRTKIYSNEIELANLSNRVRRFAIFLIGVNIIFNVFHLIWIILGIALSLKKQSTLSETA